MPRCVIELHTTRSEQLDSVVGGRVVAGRDDDAERRPDWMTRYAVRYRAGDSGRRDDAEQHDVCAGSRQAFDNRILQPAARRTRVTADDNQRTIDTRSEHSGPQSRRANAPSRR